MKPLMHAQTESHVASYIKHPASVLAIVGEPDSGKHFIARWVAQNVLDAPLETHPYFYHIDAKNSGIEEVRDLQKKLTLRVPGANMRLRAVILEDFDSFGHAAQNALLKTLEEPPLDTVLILTISRSERVLSTIFSRTPQLIVRPVSKATAISYMNSGGKGEWAHNVSNGNPALYCNLLTDSEHPLLTAVNRAKELLQADRFGRLAMIESLLKDKDVTTSQLLDALSRLLNASYGLQRAKDSRSLASETRLKLCLEAMSDLQAGVHQKLVLTRLFSRI